MLTTIASCSATIVAILGGFISSKLISINTEKNEIMSRISEITEELKHLEAIYEADLYSSKKQDALHFIRANIEFLVEEKPLNELKMIKAEERPIIAYDEMLPFWNRALNQLENFTHYEDTYNSKGVPTSYAELEDDFEYETFLILSKYFEKMERASKRSQNKFGLPFNYDYMVDSIDIDSIVVGNTIFHENNLRDNKNRIDYLNMELNQKRTREAALQYPKGISAGIVIFGLFTVLGILLPLLYVPLTVIEYLDYLKFTAMFVGGFSLCIAATIFYFLWLLKQ